MTPEEELAALKSKNAELEAAVAASKSGSADVTAKIAQLEKENQERAAREKTLTLDLAKRDTLAKYPNLKGMESLVKGATPEELETTAKTISEQIAAREAEIKKNAGPGPDAWGNIPRSVPNSIAISKDRQDEYVAVRADKALRPTEKRVKLMQMHLVDLHKKMINGTKAALGIPVS